MRLQLAIGATDPCSHSWVELSSLGIPAETAVGELILLSPKAQALLLGFLWG
jgi:hypothetical protein